MYITLSKLLYPKSEEIEVIKEDVIDKTDEQEHCFNVKISGRLLLSLTEQEAIVLMDKIRWALEDKDIL